MTGTKKCVKVTVWHFLEKIFYPKLVRLTLFWPKNANIQKNQKSVL